MDKIQGKIKFIAPSLQDEHYSTAYILGNITWLMMHSKQHETMPLHMMASQIFPAIANKQYVLGMSEKGSPLFYMAWANFDDAAEAEYLTNYNLALTHLITGTAAIVPGYCFLLHRSVELMKVNAG